MTCKLFGAAVLVGALGLGVFAYNKHESGCCMFSGKPAAKTTTDEGTTPTDDQAAPSDATLVKKTTKKGGCPGCCTPDSQTPSEGFFTSLAGKAPKGDDDGCCGGTGDCKGEGCGSKPATAAKK